MNRATTSYAFASRLAGIAAAVVALAVPSAAALAVSCPTEGSGIVCTGGLNFCAANLQCYTQVSTCPNNLVPSCAACASASPNTGCACPAGMTLCSSTNTCMANVSCPAGTTWNVCTGECQTPYVLLAPANAQSSADVKLNGTLTTTGLKMTTGAAAGSVMVSDAAGKATWQTITGSLINGAGSPNYLAKWSDADTLASGSVFDNGTNVGIGTATPDGRLTVQTGTQWDGLFLKNGNGVLNAKIGTDATTSGGGYFRLYKADASSTVMLSASGDSYINSGNVGIGTISPGSRLEVQTSGNTAITGSTTSDSADFYGVLGQSVNGIGVAGSSTNANGVVGVAQQGNGVYGVSQSASFAGTYGMNSYGVGLKGYGATGLDVTSTSSPNRITGATCNNTGCAALVVNENGGTHSAIRLQNSGATNGVIRADNSGNLFLSGGNALYLSYNDLGEVRPISFMNGRAYMNSVGLGIGTWSPRSDLQLGNLVYDDSLATNHGKIVVADAGLNGPETAGGIEFQSFENSGRAGFGAKLYTNNQNDYFGIGTRADSHSWTERLTVKMSSGNVGIGTTAPGAKLDVNGTIRAIDYGSAGSINLMVGDDTFFTDVDANDTLGLYSSRNTAVGALRLGSGGATLYGSEHGSLVIGTTGDFSQKVHIEGGSSMGLYSSSNSSYGVFGQGADRGVYGYSDSGNGVFALSANSYSLYVQGGNANPYTKGLYVNATDNLITGNLGVGIQFSPSYRVFANGAVAASSFQNVSDRRWKRNITTITSALDKVEALRGVSFDWRREEFPELDFPAGRQVGVVAQEVEKVIPEVVMTDEKGYKTVAYEKLVAVLIEAVKELSAKVAHLGHGGAERTVQCQPGVRCLCDDGWYMTGVTGETPTAIVCREL